MHLRLKLLSFCEIALYILLPPLGLVVAIFTRLFQWIFIRKSAKNISNEIAVVTGGAHGLGREICLLLAKHGCHVAVVDINIDGAEETVKLIKNNHPVKAKAYEVDISSFDQVMELKSKVTKDLGIATILVNCAGILMLSKFPNPDWREVQRMINVNLTSHFWTLDAFLPKMKELQKGHIVAVSSLAGCFPLIYNSQYTATKFGVRGLMKSLRQELLAEKLKNVHATTVYPFVLTTNTAAANGYLKTDSSKRFSMIDGADAAKTIVDGMLCNELEITLPSIVELMYCLYELFPTWWQDRMIQYTCREVTPDLMINVNQESEINLSSK